MAERLTAAYEIADETDRASSSAVRSHALRGTADALGCADSMLAGFPMNWEAMGALSQLVAAIGLIPSVVYLAIQVRAQNKAVRGERPTGTTE